MIKEIGGIDRLIKNQEVLEFAIKPFIPGLAIDGVYRTSGFRNELNALDILNKGMSYDAVIVNGSSTGDVEDVVLAALLGCSISDKSPSRIVYFHLKGVQPPYDGDFGITCIETHSGNGHLDSSDAKEIARRLEQIARQ